MALIGKGVIAIWNDIAEEGRGVFNEWHPREHMPERLSIPGFRRGRRYASDSADIEFYTLYEADSVDVITGPAYKARLNTPTPWSTEAVQHFRANIRGICRVAFSAGHADGGFMATIRLAPRDGAEAGLEAFLTKALPPILEAPRICGTHLAITDASLSGTQTKLQSTRVIRVPEWVVMIEGGSAAAVSRAAHGLVSRPEFAASGAKPEPVIGDYELEYGITKI